MYAACWLGVWEHVIFKYAYILPVMFCRLKSVAKYTLGKGLQLEQSWKTAHSVSVKRSTKDAKENQYGRVHGIQNNKLTYLHKYTQPVYICNTQ